MSGRYTQRLGSANPFFGKDDGLTADQRKWTTAACCDVDQDGDNDVIVGSTKGWIHYLKNVGDRLNPSFERSHLPGSYPVASIPGDRATPALPL